MPKMVADNRGGTFKETLVYIYFNRMRTTPGYDS